MEFNYRAFFYLMALAILATAMMCVISASASYAVVEEVTQNATYYIEDTTIYPVYSIEQGDDVYVNDTVDISRVTGWSGPDGEYRIAWYGRYIDALSPEDLDPEYIIKLPSKSRTGTTATQYRYYIDPAIFEYRTGWWYQFYSNASVNSEGAGNLRAFHVNSSKRIITVGDNTTFEYSTGEREVKPPEPLMPEKRISDVLVARGDAPDMIVAGNRAWIFGSKYGLYCMERNITRDDIWNLEPGSYTIMYQSPGNNTIYDATLSGDYLIPGLYGRKPVDISAAKNDAYVMREKFTGMVSGTDDLITSSKMEVQEPEITLERIDEVFNNGIAVLDIRGYTNAANGTKITVVLDEGRSYKTYIPERIKTTEAVRTNPGYLSYYRVYLPIDYDSLSAANAVNHTITARTDIGGVVYKDFFISVMPADSYKPNATLKYIEDRNPWVPTPTPEIVVKTEQVVVTQTVPVQIPPSQEQIAEAAKKITEEEKRNTINMAVVIAVSMVIIGFVAWFGYSLYRARRIRK